MAKRLAFSLAALAIVAGASVVGFRMLRRDAAQQGGPAPVANQPAAGTGQARLLLNEVVFLPAAGQPPWIELMNAGGQPATLDGVVLDNHAGEKIALPNRITLPAGAIMVVRFDGTTGADASVVHAASTTFLAPRGFVRLNGPQGQLDRIAWGDGQASAANLSRGGDQEDPAPGMSLGRVPRMIDTDPLAWVPYSPQQATPGRANPQPGVEILLPMDGAILTGDVGDLTWYPIAGAARYRVQLASDRSFGSTLLDQTVDQPPVRAPALAPGTYVWRVQAIAADGTAAEYSAPSTLTIRAARARAARGPSLLDWLLPRLLAHPREQEVPDDELPIVLDVPMIKQHKDTRMLILESRRESPGRFGHAWDMDHGDLAEWDSADNMNCAVASIAMLTAYYGGRLSQDRINFEAFKNDPPAGPPGDLNWGIGYSDDRKRVAIKFALGGEPTIQLQTDELLTIAFVKALIETKTPMIFCKNRHCVAIVGASGELVVINDPWRGTYHVPRRNLVGGRIIVMANEDVKPFRVTARSDEPEVSRDSDGDGVVDFDELHRFGTNPKLKDHDGDDVPDKQDIRASVHDRRHGFAYGGRGRDLDNDGKAMEKDNDSDNGGCPDGLEDRNKDGKFDQDAETDNFSKNDDPCFVGDFNKAGDWVTDIVLSDGSRDHGEYHDKQTVSFWLMPHEDGTLTGRAHATFSLENTRRMTSRGDCLMRTWVPAAEWDADLTGRFKRLPDGSVEITLSVPPLGPTIPTHSKDECPPGFSLTQTMQPPFGIPPGPYKLVNGVFQQRGEIPVPSGIGKTWWELNVRGNSPR
ncbi:MAG TPA: C39 family peptidase [Vicinamibacterales bacterium]